MARSVAGFAERDAVRIVPHRLTLAARVARLSTGVLTQASTVATRVRPVPSVAARSPPLISSTAARLLPRRLVHFPHPAHKTECRELPHPTTGDRYLRYLDEESRQPRLSLSLVDATASPSASGFFSPFEVGFLPVVGSPQARRMPLTSRLQSIESEFDEFRICPVDCCENSAR